MLFSPVMVILVICTDPVVYCKVLFPKRALPYFVMFDYFLIEFSHKLMSKVQPVVTR